MLSKRSRTLPTSRDLTPADAVNEAEWRNAENWTGELLYHARLDTRTIVPDRASRLGYTINLGRPLVWIAAIGLVALILGSMLSNSWRR
jgi:uncharacterized membrane protein